MNKKGQVTIFIIIGILIVVFALIFLYTKTNIEKKNIETEKEIQKNFMEENIELKTFIDSCLGKNSYERLKLVGKQGGYQNIPGILTFKNKSYWYYDQVNIQPTLEEIRIWLEENLNSNANNCNYSIYENRGFSFDFGIITSEVKFNLNDVMINFDFPIQVKKNDLGLIGITTDALHILAKYPWPGNVRELENLITKIIMLRDEHDTSDISVDEIPQEISAHPKKDKIGQNKLQEFKPDKGKRKMPTREVLMALLKECDGNKTKAAAKIGIRREHLSRELK